MAPGTHPDFEGDLFGDAIVALAHKLHPGPAGEIVADAAREILATSFAEDAEAEDCLVRLKMVLGYRPSGYDGALQ
ncbi:hypothetical protein [Sphingomonas bacterium]|uniref:hypothetical protein n=1 Tax=Sphingomonas bacterium TaxID=1895847 RepID=UPI00157671C3|nr:hypothetical protein [Sphingomonas bacterium]